MHCPDNENVCSVKKENNLGFYRLHTIWKNNSFFINITSKDGAWRGEMTPNDISSMSAQLQMNPESYLNLCKTALTTHDGHTGMVYAVESGAFVWKKIIDEDTGIKVKMGSIMVEPTNFVETIQNLVDAALNCNKKLQQQVDEINHKKQKALESQNDLLNNINELIKSKETMENDLYTKFILLINTKKKKIKELKCALGEKMKSSETCSLNYKNFDDPYEVDTDNDECDSERAAKTSLMLKEKTQTQKSNPKSKSKNNVLFEENQEEKKAKTDDVNEMSISYECANYLGSMSPEQGISNSKSEDTLKEIPSTKDELLDYFYGDS